MKDDTLLAKWLAGELKGEELEALKKSAKYPLLLRIKENFGHIAQPAFNSEGMLETILEADKNPTKVIPIYRRSWFQAIAAIVVLFFATAIYLMAPNTEEARKGETYAFALPDKSEVILNAGSEASYNGRNWVNNREVKLDGEAYFRVAKGKKFEVKTAQGTVTVLGTQFNVKARDRHFEVACYEGKVLVAHKNREFILMPGQRIVFAGNTDSGVTGTDVMEPQWLHQELVFADAELAEVVSELERQYDVTIDAPLSSAQVFSGSLPGDNIDAALKGLSLTFHLRAGKREDTIILTPVHAGK